ncbi:hypothetical protein [Psychrobacter sp. ASPA161_6]|uniref:hypothetical protein n=1 Tax=Psychrobacter sp. ASPA161_6 TaxID=3160962 RepID=UPI003F81B530
MAIQVLLAGTDEAAIILLDDVNNESVLVPLGELDDALKKISDIRSQKRFDDWQNESDEDKAKRMIGNLAYLKELRDCEGSAYIKLNDLGLPI